MWPVPNSCCFEAGGQARVVSGLQPFPSSLAKPKAWLRVKLLVGRKGEIAKIGGRRSQALSQVCD